MKLAYILRQYGRQGGISRTVADLAERFAAQGHAVTIYCQDAPASPPPGLRFVIVPAPRRPRFLFTALFPRRASRLAMAAGHDIVHGQGADCRGADVITAHSCHRYAMDRLRREGPLRDRLKKWVNPMHPVVFWQEAFNFSPRGQRQVIAVSESVAAELVAVYGLARTAITVIPNSVDAQTFRPDPERRRRFRERWGLGERPLLLFVGYEFERKGLNEALALLAALRRRDALLAVVGKPATAHARALCARHGVAARVLFTGPVAEVADCYAAADCFVFPTRYEPFGLVIAEAMASGLPVLTSRAAGIAELIRDGEEGILCDLPPDLPRLAARIDALLDDAAARSRLGEAARRRMLADCDPDRNAGRVMAVYGGVLAARAAGNAEAV